MLFWLILLAGVLAGTAFAGVLILLHVQPGLACLLSPALTVIALWFALWIQSPLLAVDPFTFIALFLVFWVAMASAFFTGRRMLRGESVRP